ncbi:MAG: hypothetical protein ABR922_24955, partial [Streptosporangiaceae bacterium]
HRRAHLIPSRWLPARGTVGTAFSGEDLLSLIYFYEANPDAVIESLPAPIGRASFPRSSRTSTWARSSTPSP